MRKKKDSPTPVSRRALKGLGNLGTATYSFLLSALLKYSLQKINYAIAAWHNPEFVSLSATQAPKTRVGAPAAAGLQQPGNNRPILSC
jgi:hypothetical protein